MYIVTGMHRSGTTVFGEIIKRFTKGHMIYEPLNKNTGVKGVDYWYQYLDKRKASHSHIIKSLLDVNLDFKKTRNLNDSFFRKITRNFIYSRGHYDYVRFKYFSWKKRHDVIYKDPFLLLNVNNFALINNVKILVIVRHPVAVYNSLLSKNWSFDLNELYSQKELKDSFLSEINVNVQQQNELISFLWSQLYKSIIHNKDKNVFFVTHEELSLDPFKVIKRISEFLELSINGSVERFVRKNFFSTSIKSRNNQIHDYKRNSRKLAWDWRKEYKEEYKSIEEICKEELKFFYPEIYK